MGYAGLTPIHAADPDLAQGGFCLTVLPAVVPLLLLLSQQGMVISLDVRFLSAAALASGAGDCGLLAVPSSVNFIAPARGPKRRPSAIDEGRWRRRWSCDRVAVVRLTHNLSRRCDAPRAARSHTRAVTR
jgi:hypothetical protein